MGWLSPRRPAALEQTAATLERMAGVGAPVGYSGHGRGDGHGGALARARRRVEGRRRDPEAVGWHACKRIFAHALMLEDGIAEARSRRAAGMAVVPRPCAAGVRAAPADLVQRCCGRCCARMRRLGGACRGRGRASGMARRAGRSDPLPA